MKSILVLFSLVCSSIAHAQFVSVPYSMHTPGGNVTMYNHVYMPTHYYGGQGSPKFKFIVTLTDGTELRFKSKMNVEKKKMFITDK